MSPISHHDAQHRVDQITAFRREMAELLNAKLIPFDAAHLQPVTNYHDNLLKTLAKVYDVDLSRQEKQLSLGMKIVSLLGALALGASVFFLFYQFWGRIPVLAQTAILVTAPCLGLIATACISSQEKSGYFAKLAGMVTFACFVLNLTMLGKIYSVTASPNAFLVWAIFALLVAYAIDARLLLTFGILGFSAFLSARMGTWGGGYWLYFGMRPENFFPAALVLGLVSLAGHRSYSGFSSTYRIFAMLLFFLPVLVLANYGSVSYLDFSRYTIQHGYQVCGFIGSALAIALGLRRSWPEVINCGTVFFTVFLYTKFYEWWWDIFPKYLFFLVIGLAAILMLLVLRRLRQTMTDPQKEAQA